MNNLYFRVQFNHHFMMLALHQCELLKLDVEIKTRDNDSAELIVEVDDEDRDFLLKQGWYQK